MKEQKQKKPEKSSELLLKLSSALKKNLQRRKGVNNIAPPTDPKAEKPPEALLEKDA